MDSLNRNGDAQISDFGEKIGNIKGGKNAICKGITLVKNDTVFLRIADKDNERCDVARIPFKILQL